MHLMEAIKCLRVLKHAKRVESNSAPMYYLGMIKAYELFSGKPLYDIDFEIDKLERRINKVV